jgi:hypothetical protein
MTGKGNRSTRRKPALVPLCPPQSPSWLDPSSNPGRRGGSEYDIYLQENKLMSCVELW